METSCSSPPFLSSTVVRETSNFSLWVCQFEWLLEKDIVKSFQINSEQSFLRFPSSYSKFFCKLGILTSPLPEVIKVPICSYAENVDFELCQGGKLRFRERKAQS